MKKKKDMKKPLLAAVLACSMVQIPAIPVAACSTGKPCIESDCYCKFL